MGKIVEKAKKKKKGRPSLLDLQKRTVRQQQQQQQQQRPKTNPNPNSNPNSTRRSTRRNPNSAGISPAVDRIYREQDDDDDDDDDDDSGGSSNGKRKEKKLKLVLRLPPHQQNASCTSSLKSEDEKGEEAPLKRRKINAVVGVRSGFPDGEEGGNDLNNATKTIDSVLGTGKALEPGPTTPLPDKKLLVFILDRIQKKDTYGVFSEPVDPNELPDYHDIIEHPMDFSTVRNKLSGGAYAFLEQFEKDVFLICSNAMKYNASDTIYFRQARAIQELAKKNFENLRQDSDDNEPEPKIVRRGRPPTKNLKRPIGRPPLDWAGSELSSDAVLANNGVDPTSSYSHDLRKSSYPEKSGPIDQSGRTFTVSRNSEERKPERNDEFPATMSKNFSTKFGKKHFIFDENRRNTCKQFLTSLGHEQTVLNTFDGQKKQLTAVGLHSQHGFARSVARFAADLGPIIWKIASKKIERALPTQTMFGPGWVGEKDMPLSRPLIYTSSTTQALVFQQSISLPKTSSTSVPCTSDPKADKFAKKQEFLNNSNPEVHSNGTASPCALASSSCAVATESHEPNAGRLEAAGDLNCENGFGALKSFPSGIKPTPSEIQPRPFLNSGMNGFSGSFRFNLASQMAKFARPGLAAGSFNPEILMRPQMLEMVSRGSNNFVCPIPANHLDSGHQNLPEGPSTVASDSAGEAKEIAGAGFRNQPQQQSSFPGLSQHQKLDPVPPDLNLRFHSPGSPSCSQQPHLAL